MKKILLAAVLVSIFSLTGFPKENGGKENLFQSLSIYGIKEFDKTDILRKMPLNTDKFIFNAYFLEPRQLLKFHRHPASDELFYLVEGQGQFTVGGNQVMVDSGSVIYGPAGTNHGIVNSGKNNIILLSVQAPKPVKTIFAENSTIICQVCGQEDIIPADAKEGDIFQCPRCQTKLKLSKNKDGKWTGTPVE